MLMWLACQAQALCTSDRFSTVYAATHAGTLDANINVVGVVGSICTTTGTNASVVRLASPHTRATIARSMQRTEELGAIEGGRVVQTECPATSDEHTSVC